MKKKKEYFLWVLPFLILVFIFSYFPLHGWIYAFYDYKPPLKLSQCEFVGLQWFKMLFGNKAQLKQMLQVMENTFAMSLLGIATSFLPVIFAIFLNEVKCKWFKTLVQTLTTLEYLENNDMLLVAQGSSYVAPEEDSNISTLRGQCKSTIVDYSWKMVFASDEDEFNSLLKEMQENVEGLGYEDVLAVDMQNAKDQAAARAEALAATKSETETETAAERTSETETTAVTETVSETETAAVTETVSETETTAVTETVSETKTAA